MRDTSRQAYEYIVSSGKLKERMTEAYKVFYHHGPLTGQELNSKMKGDGAWKLCSQLKMRGVLKEVGERPCSITGRNAILWDVTSNLPVKPPKNVSKTKKQKKDEILVELRELYKISHFSCKSKVQDIAEMVKRI